MWTEVETAASLPIQLLALEPGKTMKDGQSVGSFPQIVLIAGARLKSGAGSSVQVSHTGAHILKLSMWASG